MQNMLCINPIIVNHDAILTKIKHTGMQAASMENFSPKVKDMWNDTQLKTIKQ